MNAPLPTPTPAEGRFMSGAEYRESLRRYRPVVYVDGQRIDSVADAPQLQPGINALAVSYDFARDAAKAALMTAVQSSRGRRVNRMLHVDESAGDLLNKLEAVRLLCQETGCAQRYLAHDALNALAQVTARIDDARGSNEHRARFQDYLAHVQDEDLALGIAMTDAKGDRSRRPHEQAHPDTYVHVVERNAKGIVISGTKAIVTGAPYMHEILVMPGRQMGPADADFAVCCALPCDAPGLTLVSRPAGRPGDRVEHGAPLFSRRYGQATAVLIFDRVFVPWERVFYAGEWEHSHVLTYSYATHHRHSCIGARAGFGDLLIGAGALMCEANGLDPGAKSSLREPMVELIKITEGFYACGVAASVYGTRDPHSGSFMPDRQAAAGDADLRHAPAGARRIGRPRRRPARPRRGPQPGHRRHPGRGAARQPGRALRQAHRGGALHRGPHGFVPGRLVFGDQPARRRLAGGHEAGDLAPVPRGRQGGTGGAAARPRRADAERRRRHAGHHAQPPAWPLLRPGLQRPRAGHDGAVARPGAAWLTDVDPA